MGAFRNRRLPPCEEFFGRAATVVRSAPGRVNLIGEHTDYNDGLVLPLALARCTTVELVPGDTDRVRAVTDFAATEGIREYRLGNEAPGGDWLDFVQGCSWAMRARMPPQGFALRITSTVPPGAGLASSAALTVGIVRALAAHAGTPLDPRELALLAHRAEHDFVGARVGVMDHFAASLGDPGHALFLDTRDLSTEKIPLPEALGLVVIDSGIAHRHASGEYNRRRAECEAARDSLGVRSLREITLTALSRIAALPEPLGRRVRHVASENERVQEACHALRRGDLQHLGQLFYASHRSLRDDYEVSTPEVDQLVELAMADPDVCGARLTGGGFGGSVVVAVRAGTEQAVARRVLAAYCARTGVSGRTLLPCTEARAVSETPA